MNTIYHILGSPIPHHNHTVLTFFAQELSQLLTVSPHHFYVVAKDDQLLQQFPQLNIHLFESKKSVAKAVVNTARQKKNAQFIFHGQFNVRLWLAILLGDLPAYRCIWHIWGADLYQDAKGWKFKPLYPLRRLAQNKLPQIWATQGDLVYAKRLLKRKVSDDSVVYFPTKMEPALALPLLSKKSNFLTILVGNSGDKSNRHLIALEQIANRLGSAVKVIMPMGYPEHNEDYIEQVRAKAESLFPKNQIELLDKRVDFNQYLQLLSECDLGYFIFERQQGIGTICLLTQCNIPVVLHSENPFTIDMEAENIPFLYPEQLTLKEIEAKQRELNKMDKSVIRFFYPNYIQQWKVLLQQLVQRVTK